MEPARVNIDLVAKGEFVEAPDFLAVLRNTLAILKQIERTATQSHRGSSSWLISEASLKSPLHLTLSEDVGPDQTEQHATMAVRHYLAGLTYMQAETPPDEPPPFFDGPTLVNAKRLAATFDSNITSLQFSSPEVGSVTCTRRMIVNIEELLASKFRAKGALEGRIETVSERRGLHFDLLDQLTKVRVTCHAETEDVMKRAHSAWRHRAVVYGQVKYDKNGKPLSMKVEDLRQLRSRGELPQPADLRNVDITSGVESSEYIRRLRSAD